MAEFGTTVHQASHSKMAQKNKISLLSLQLFCRFVHNNKIISGKRKGGSITNSSYLNKFQINKGFKC